MDRRSVQSGARWESIAGYSRAVRVGDAIWVAGTSAVGPDGAVVGKGDPAAQLRRCVEIVQAALAELGAGLEHVVRTRMYVTDISQWEAIARAHGEAFGEIRPVTAMIEVKGLVDPDMLVELECDAVIPSRASPAGAGRR